MLGGPPDQCAAPFLDLAGTPRLLVADSGFYPGIFLTLTFYVMKIVSIKFVTSKAGKRLALINDAIWVSLAQWLNAGGRQSTLLQIGWTLNVEYFRVGDVLLNGTVCDKANAVVKSFSISPSATLVANLESEFARFEAASAFGVAVSTPQPVAPARPAPKLEAPADEAVVETDVEADVEADVE